MNESNEHPIDEALISDVPRFDTTQIRDDGDRDGFAVLFEQPAAAPSERLDEQTTELPVVEVEAESVDVDPSEIETTLRTAVVVPSHEGHHTRSFEAEPDEPAALDLDDTTMLADLVEVTPTTVAPDLPPVAFSEIDADVLPRRRRRTREIVAVLSVLAIGAGAVAIVGTRDGAEAPVAKVERRQDPSESFVDPTTSTRPRPTTSGRPTTSAAVNTSTSAGTTTSTTGPSKVGVNSETDTSTSASNPRPSVTGPTVTTPKPTVRPTVAPTTVALPAVPTPSITGVNTGCTAAQCFLRVAVAPRGPNPAGYTFVLSGTTSGPCKTTCSGNCVASQCNFIYQAGTNQSVCATINVLLVRSSDGKTMKKTSATKCTNVP